LLADEVDGYFDPAGEPYELLLLSDLEIPFESALRFRLPQQPLSYAATPYLIAHLLETRADRVLFLKQESFVLAELASLAAELEAGRVALTPHLLNPLNGDDATERELMVLLAGTFNTGLVAAAAGEPTARLLSWWQDRVTRDCRFAVAEGVHYEQRWLDLAPAYFDGVDVIRDPGVNVGHWNLPDRAVRLTDDVVHADGSRCRLFRFSGYDPERKDFVTRYSNRLRTADLGDAANVFTRYHDELIAAGWEEARSWPYAYDRFDNGVSIPHMARDIYRRLPDAARFGDPFDTRRSPSFFAWLRQPVGRRGPSSFWAGVYEARPDLQAHFPSIQGHDRRAFRRWTQSCGVVEHQVPEALR
jgi:hypothetical protein